MNAILGFILGAITAQLFIHGQTLWGVIAAIACLANIFYPWKKKYLP